MLVCLLAVVMCTVDVDQGKILVVPSVWVCVQLLGLACQTSLTAMCLFPLSTPHTNCCHQASLQKGSFLYVLCRLAMCCFYLFGFTGSDRSSDLLLAKAVVRRSSVLHKWCCLMSTFEWRKENAQFLWFSLFVYVAQFIHSEPNKRFFGENATWIWFKTEAQLGYV